MKDMDLESLYQQDDLCELHQDMQKEPQSWGREHLPEDPMDGPISQGLPPISIQEDDPASAGYQVVGHIPSPVQQTP